MTQNIPYTYNALKQIYRFLNWKKHRDSCYKRIFLFKTVITYEEIMFIFVLLPLNKNVLLVKEAQKLFQPFPNCPYFFLRPIRITNKKLLFGNIHCFICIHHTNTFFVSTTPRLQIDNNIILFTNRLLHSNYQLRLKHGRATIIYIYI